MKNEFLKLDVEDGVALVRMDHAGAPVNTLSIEALAALGEALDVLEEDSDLRAAVFLSGKPDSFIAGADLKALQGVTRPAEAEALSRTAHRLLGRVRGLGKPTVAAIHGPALGGGLELALACTYRIASDHARTRLGLPEVRLGLLPGGGGTQLLPRLIGLPRALDLLLTGKNIYPTSARRAGLVDDLIHVGGLKDAALTAARRLADGDLSPDQGPRRLSEKVLQSNPLTRRVVYARARSRALGETKGHYPAPLEIIRCVRLGMEKGLQTGLDAEAEAFGRLACSPVARQLIFLFFAKQSAEKNPWAEEAAAVEQVGILGAGLMGGGIAQVSAENGLEVLLKDQDLERAAAGKQKVWRHAERLAAKGVLSSFERDTLVERVTPIDDYAALGGANLVIEAAPESLPLKQQLLQETEAVISDATVYASNTSSIPIARLAEAAARPERVLGMHYFSPVDKVPLLELVRTQQTDTAALATAFEVGLRQGKTIIVVNDAPGFYTTRILSIYMNEALRLLEEGAIITEVDAVMTKLGFPMGPFALFDLVGIDVAAKITEVLGGFFAARGLEASTAAGRMIRAGYLGRKSGRGFYRYEADQRKSPSSTRVNEAVYAYFGGARRSAVSPEDVRERLLLVMVNEAVYCLDEGVLQAPRDGDVGAVFGLGFPPYLGGPFRYVDAQTSPAILRRLERLSLNHGPVFEAPSLLREYAAAGRGFYDEEPG